VLCSSTGVDQGVAVSPCWSMEQSLMLHGSFAWRYVVQRNGQSGEEHAGRGPDEPWPRRQDQRCWTSDARAGPPCMMPRAPPMHWLR